MLGSVLKGTGNLFPYNRTHTCHHKTGIHDKNRTRMSAYGSVTADNSIVFTGGIGEFSTAIREKVLQGVRSLGVNICKDRNEECFGKAGVISTDDSTLKAIVMPTNEELMIAESAVEVLA